VARFFMGHGVNKNKQNEHHGILDTIDAADNHTQQVCDLMLGACSENNA